MYAQIAHGASLSQALFLLSSLLNIFRKIFNYRVSVYSIYIEIMLPYITLNWPFLISDSECQSLLNDKTKSQDTSQNIYNYQTRLMPI